MRQGNMACHRSMKVATQDLREVALGEGVWGGSARTDQAGALGEGLQGIQVVSEGIVGARQAQVEVGEFWEVLERGETAGGLQAAVGLQAHCLQLAEAQERLYHPRPHRRHPHLCAQSFQTPYVSPSALQRLYRQQPLW